MLDSMIQSLVGAFTDEAVPEASLSDFSGAAGLYFVRIRTPAAWIAGSSLGAFFSFSKSPNLEQQSTVLYKSCLGFFLASFLLSFATVVLATGTSIAILHPNNRQKAENVWTLLHREFEFEFVFTRWAYWMSLLCFLMAVTLRAVLEFQWTTLRPHHQRNSFRAFLCIMTAVMTQLLSHIHRHLYSFHHLGHMTARVLQMMIQRCLQSKDPLQAISIVATILAGYYGLKALRQTEIVAENVQHAVPHHNENNEKCKDE